MLAQSTCESRHNFKLVFAAERGSSRPKLTTIGELSISRADLLPWEDELNEAYERIYAGSRWQIFRFQTRLGRLPISYEVEVKPTLAHGVHSLELTPIVADCNATTLRVESLPVPIEPPAVPAPAEWPAEEFVEALDLLFQRLPLQSPGRAGIDVVLTELAGLAQRSPIELLLILFSGYLDSAHSRQSGSDRDLAFVNASYAIDQVCAVLSLEVPAARAAAPQVWFDRHVRQLVERLFDRL